MTINNIIQKTGTYLKTIVEQKNQVNYYLLTLINSVYQSQLYLILAQERNLELLNFFACYYGIYQKLIIIWHLM